MLLPELDDTVRRQAATAGREYRDGPVASVLRLRRLFCAVAILATFSANALATSPLQQPILATSVDPVVLMRGKDIATCGFSAQFADGNVKAVVTLSLQKYKPARDGTRIVLAADWRDAGGVRHDIRHMHFKTDDTEDVSVDIAPGEARGIIERAGLQGALLFRNAMLAGAHMDLTDATGEVIALTIPGPVPQSVRAAYLNCAGDMFKPAAPGKR